ncbi:hypothetical protein ACJ2A9_17875 [Anaerobacillus sp. MEB173]|uniref:hypothetical protein n=1 Tax=Anaerobacillus sp. MEB173 TaxID=3383345 RepID=UPI003F92B8E7
MIKNGSIENFAAYSQFHSVNEFNAHIELWLNQHGNQFSKGEHIGLQRLLRYSVKIIGVANVKIATALKVIHEEYYGNGISRSTFKRMIAKAKYLGILEVIELKRESGGQSSNLYVFQRFPKSMTQNELPHNNDFADKNANLEPPTDKALPPVHNPDIQEHHETLPNAQLEPPNDEQLNHHKTTLSLKTTNNKKITKRNQTPCHNNHTIDLHINEHPLDHSYTSERVPHSFKNLMKSFCDHYDKIEEYWSMVQVAAYKNNYDNDGELMTDIAIQSFKQMIRGVKKKTIRRPIAYFYGILMKKFEEVYVKELSDSDFGEGCAAGTWLER